MPAADKSDWWSKQDIAGRKVLDENGFHSWDPRVIHLSFANASFPVRLPTVQSGVLSETDPLTADASLGTNAQGTVIHENYIQWLAQAPIKDIHAENYPGPKPTALLYKILRLAVILEYGKLASNAEISAGKLTTEQTREPELIGMGAEAGATGAAKPLGVWDILTRPSIPAPALSWGDYLSQLIPPAGSPFAELKDFRSCLKNLSMLPTAELDRLLTETLDACSHRLDVWATSAATAILMRTRQSQGVAGVHLAAYGWLEDLRPAAKRSAVSSAEQKQIQMLDSMRQKKGVTETPPPVMRPQVDNGGFIYAPSQDQAAVAAILRSGYMSHKGTSDEDTLAIDLSSERVRGALTLLDGIRQSQSLNALLGYLFEGGLHDLKLQQYVQPFRDKFPMAANQATPADPGTTAMAASNVVDGIALQSAWHNNQLDNGQYWGNHLPNAPQEQNAIVGLLQTLDGYADCLGDLSIAEALYQTVRGNFERAGGLLEAVSRGQRPPEPEVIHTPRGGLDITHRVGLLFAGALPANAWTGSKNRARAAAEPWLDAWLSQMLPDPANTVAACTVSYHDKNLGDKNATVKFSQLGLSPLDCIAMGENSTNASQRSELEYRILYAAGVPPTADPGSITITYKPTSDSGLSFPDLLYLWKCLRLLASGARPIAPQDFVLPANKIADSDQLIDSAGLLARATAALNMLQKDLAYLKDSMSGGQPAAKPAGCVMDLQLLRNCRLGTSFPSGE